MVSTSYLLLVASWIQFSTCLKRALSSDLGSWPMAPCAHASMAKSKLVHEARVQVTTTNLNVSHHSQMGPEPVWTALATQPCTLQVQQIFEPTDRQINRSSIKRGPQYATLQRHHAHQTIHTVDNAQFANSLGKMLPLSSVSSYRATAERCTVH